MDKTRLSVVGRFVSASIFSVLLLTACGSPPSPVKKAVNSASAVSLPPEPVKVEKPVNVSFSTYSKEWPVGWQWIDPDEKQNPTPKDVKKGVLRVRIPTGKELHGNNLTAPRYIKPIVGDFQIETRVRFLPKENYQGAGLLIYHDDNNYLRFERAYGGFGGGGEGIRVDVRQNGEYTSLATPKDIQTDASEVDLKIVRSDKVFIAFWRVDEESEWREAAEFISDFPDTVFAGVAASNTAREVTAEFVYIRLLPATKP